MRQVVVFDSSLKVVRVLVALLLALSSLLAGCSESETPDESAASQESTIADASADEALSDELGIDETSDLEADAPDEAADAAEEEVDAPGASPNDVSGPAKKDRAGLRPFEFPYAIEVPGSAAVSAECVTRGEEITLEVQTEPEAALGYQAIYHGNESGADAPFGGGHGGNDKGQATINGTWADAWIVGPKAPFGMARVDVVIGWEGKWGYEKAYFTVARSAGDCP